MNPEPIALGELNTQPLVSIVTPCYNAAAYIALTIESVQTQSYENWEMVICDDGSKDESADIIESFAAKDFRIRLLRQENAGAAAATNAAYDESRGDIIAFLDADDLFGPSKLEKCVAAFHGQPGSGYLTHRLKSIDHLGEDSGIILPGVPSLVDGWFAPYLFDKVPTRGSSAPSAGNLVRREVMERVMPIPSKCERTQDAYVLTCAMLLTPAIGLEKVLGSYRIHPGGQSRGELYTEAFHERRMSDIRKSISAIRDFTQREGFDELATYLERDYYKENVGYLENVIIYYLLTGNLPPEMNGENIEQLFSSAGPKGQRFQSIRNLPLFLRRNLLYFYAVAGKIASPLRNAFRNKRIMKSA